MIDAERHPANELFYKFIYNKADLSQDDIENIENHLKECDRCKSEMETLTFSFGG